MGKLRALKFGIVKGVKHTEKALNPKTYMVNKLVAQLKCIECGHASDSHTVRKPEYENMEAKKLFHLIAATGFKGSRGFDECQFYECEECKK